MKNKIVLFHPYLSDQAKKAVMDTLGLGSGDKILIKFDPDLKKLIIEEEK